MLWGWMTDWTLVSSTFYLIREARKRNASNSKSVCVRTGSQISSYETETAEERRRWIRMRRMAHSPLILSSAQVVVFGEIGFLERRAKSLIRPLTWMRDTDIAPHPLSHSPSLPHHAEYAWQIETGSESENKGGVGRREELLIVVFKD